MAHKIFLSHNYKDKPLVEAVALRLADIFGQGQVFYDSWSIRPGDGIIDEMNKGLDAPEVVFFFVSADSLQSDMVRLEWQNALYSATKGATRLVPIRVDGSEMPALLKQTCFIDMHAIGLDAAIQQIVDIAQGGGKFVPQHEKFSNLSHRIVMLDDGSLEVTISASHMLEPNPNFALVLMNEESDVRWWIKDHPGINGGFAKDAFLTNEGPTANAVILRPIVGSLTPSHPLTFQLIRSQQAQLDLICVLHDQGGNKWRAVPAAK
ncbi:toll/interleukin-1 receptor domain-containing protein [Stenotrophomonas terrae]|uniref:toll/interleukin-1 receptor domain-containing protein n=1 Tax=Stenotrophomonas terrae TaxID=405446 RepID=UPI003209D88F